jgi:hypothetical protein
MFFIIYFIGFVPAYFVVRTAFIKDELDGRMDRYTELHRIQVIAFSIFSWFSVVGIGFTVLIVYLITISKGLNKRAKW